MYVPRTPTVEEMKDLEAELAQGLSRDGKTVQTWEKATAHQIVSCAAIAVFDYYPLLEDLFPSYLDKVMVVIWADHPQLCDVYIWNSNGIEEIALCRHDIELRR